MAALDSQLLARLPLPLAQLYRRAHNALTPHSRHQAAYYLGEASLKLLACVAVGRFVDRGQTDPAASELLKSLARPSLGHWYALASQLGERLAKEGDPGFERMHQRWNESLASSLSHAAELHERLGRILEAPGKGPSRVRDLYERLTQWRSREIGHGAAGMRPESVYDDLSGPMLAGIAELCERLDPLVGGSLVYVADVRLQRGGSFLLERFRLQGESAARLESRELPAQDGAQMPRPHKVYWSAARDAEEAAERLTSLHPLLYFNLDRNLPYFFNGRHGKRGVAYLCYGMGEDRRDDLEADHRELLARALQIPVDAALAEQWADESLTDAPPEPAAFDDGEAPTLGEFRLLSRLGRGAMGVVYRAWQRSLQRQVALKRLLRSGDAKAEARFRREVQALGRVDHPHLVKVFAAGVEDEQWYFAMDLVEGCDLASVCRGLATQSTEALARDTWAAAVSTACEHNRRQEEPLEGADAELPPAFRAPKNPPADNPQPAPAYESYVHQVVELVRQVAEATDALHEAGVIHRDIKPGNIMVTEDGRQAVLMDLGLAQLIDDAEGRLTRTRQFVGTLRYASPEQVLGSAALDRRTDIYSLGATLWELLTLRPMFGAHEDLPDHELMLRIASADPENPQKYNPRVPGDLYAIVAKCLEKDRARRYATAGDLADDLRRFLRGDPVIAQPPSLRYFLAKFSRRNRAALATAAAIAAVLVAGVVLAFVGISREAARTQLALTENQRLLALNHLQLGGNLADNNLVDSGVQEMVRGYESLPVNDPLRSKFATIINNRLDRIGSLLVHPQTVRSFSFSGDSTRIATTDGRRTITLWETATGRMLGKPYEIPPSSGGNDGIRTCQLNARGDLVAVLGFSQVEVVDATSWRKLASLPLDDPWSVQSLAFTPDNQSLVFSERGAAVFRWPFAAKGEKQELLKPQENVTNQWSESVAGLAPGGDFICRHEPAGLVMYSTEDGSLVHGPTQHGSPVNGFRISPTGQFVICFSADHVCLWDVRRNSTTSISYQTFNDAAIVENERRLLAIAGDYVQIFEIGLQRRYDAPVPAAPAADVPPAAEAPAAAVAVFASEEPAAAPTPPEGGAREDADFLERLVSPERTLGVIGSGGIVDDEFGRSRSEQAIARCFSPNGRYSVSRHSGSSLRLHDISERGELGRRLGVLAPDGSTAPRAWGQATPIAAFSDDESTIAMSWGAAAVLWDTASGARLTEPELKNERDGLAAIHNGETISLHDGFSESQRELISRWGLDQPQASADGSVFVGLGDAGEFGRNNAFGVWNASGERTLFKKYDRTIDKLSLSADGKRLLTMFPQDSDIFAKECWLWYLDQRDKHISVGRNLLQATMSPDGTLLATADDQGVVAFYDLASGKPLGQRLPHSSDVTYLGFDESSQMVICGCEDGLTLLWDRQTWLPLSFPLQGGQTVRWAIASQSHRYLAALTDRNHVFLYRLPAPSTVSPVERAQILTQLRSRGDGSVAAVPYSDWIKLVPNMLGD